MTRAAPITAVGIAVALGARGAALTSAAAGTPPVDFVRDVRPILEQRCYGCHGPEKQKSGLRLDVREAAVAGGEFHAPTIVPGDPDASALIRFVRGDDAEIRMPADGAPLPSDEVATLVSWVEQGAVWPDGVDQAKLEDRTDHWAFKPLAQFGNEPLSIDSFVHAELREHTLEMAPPADRLTWLRRVTLDLTGLPPSPEEVRAFLSDRSGGACEQAVDRLLASPRYGERWAQRWLDVVRYADTHGFEVNTERPHAWPYRDYVIDAFNRDTPFDQFIREQLAGDLLGQDAATGFLVTAARLLPGQIGQDPASMRLARQDELGEIVINTGEAFLGLSIGCARCHNHKFDPISARDYYAMQAFFSGVQYGDRPIRSPEADATRGELARMENRAREIDRMVAGFVPAANSGAERPPVRPTLNVERFEPRPARRVRFTILRTNLYEPCLDELEIFSTGGENVALASAGSEPTASSSNVEANRHQLEFLNDGEFGNTRSWMCGSETGWAMIELPRVFTIDRIVLGRDRHGEYDDRLAIDYRIEVDDGAGTWTAVAGSDDRAPWNSEAGPDDAWLTPEEGARAEALQSEKELLQQQIAALADSHLVFGGAFGSPEPVRLLHRGDPEQPMDEAAPAVPEALGSVKLPADAPDAARRSALADWIADPANPLTARVAVNRIWQGHFGIGLVETSNDFGRAGAPPSHPRLLDWLARTFIDEGWSVKRMHRKIVLSETYRQSARIDPAAQAVDADVRLLWRFPSRRLEAEAIRDSILAVSGRLNLESGGPGFDLFETRGGLTGFPPVESFARDGRRRMIYAHKVRMEPDAVFGAFDCPDAGQSVSRRRQSTTPIQALNLFNSQFTADEAKAFAERVRREAGPDDEAAIRRACALAFGREPEEAELADALPVVRRHGLESLCRVIFNSSEFLFLP